ncbi:hypothetical protein ACLKA6_013822 [Drosophila palustris]
MRPKSAAKLRGELRGNRAVNEFWTQAGAHWRVAVFVVSSMRQDIRIIVLPRAVLPNWPCAFASVYPHDVACKLVCNALP